MKLILGTANFAKEYRGVLVSEKEQVDIFQVCWENQIDTVDTATSYGKIKIPRHFEVIDKVVRGDVIPKDRYAVLLHHIEDYPSMYERMKRVKCKVGLSIYHPKDLLKVDLDYVDILQFPYNQEYQVFGDYLQTLSDMGIELHIRSIFRTIQTDGLEECVRFAYHTPHIDKIVVGVENSEQLKQIIEIGEKYE